MNERRPVVSLTLLVGIALVVVGLPAAQRLQPALSRARAAALPWAPAAQAESGEHDLQPLPASGAAGALTVQVLNQLGLPAASAHVEAYSPPSLTPVRSGNAGTDGRVTLSLSDGTYTLVASSMNDHFVVERAGVAAPGSVTLDTMGCVQVDVTARRVNGTPLPAAGVSFERFGGMNSVGHTDVNGRLRVSLTPGTYNGLAQHTGERYYLNRRALAITQAGPVLFDVAQMSVGRLVFHRAVAQAGVASDEDRYGLLFWPDPACRNWASDFLVDDGSICTLSAESYDITIVRDVRVWDAMQPVDWEGSYVARDDPFAIPAGGQADLSAGGTHTALIQTERATYHPSDLVKVNQSVKDGFGNSLRYLMRNYEPVMPALVVTHEQGRTVYSGYCGYYLSYCTFNLPADAPLGHYTVNWSLDTGPLQGALTGQTGFDVISAEVKTYTPTPSPTTQLVETPTPTPTDTKTPTPTPTASPTDTETPTATPTPTASPTLIPSATQTPTVTPTRTLTPAATVTLTPSSTPTGVPSATAIPSVTTSATPRWAIYLPIIRRTWGL